MRTNIELEVITPLSCGAGNDNDWNLGADYVRKNGKIYVLDLPKAVKQGVDINKLSAYLMQSNEGSIINLLGNKLENVSKYVYDAPASTTNPIKTFIRTQLNDRPIVPGSSLKGSIRSALFFDLWDNTVVPQNPKSNQINESVFGSMKDGTDFMRFIQVGDIEMPSTVLVNSKIFNLHNVSGEWYGGWKHGGYTDDDYKKTGFNTLYECVEPGAKGQGNITLSTEQFKKVLTPSYVNEKKAIMNNGINELFRVINDCTTEYLYREEEFFKQYDADRTDEILRNIDRLIRQMPEDNSECLLKMSAGTGFHSITGDWQYDDFTNTGTWSSGRNAGKMKYKSRKICEYKGKLQLMGFVKLRVKP